MANFLNSCVSPFFQMKSDVYYATESQDQYGKIEKKWQFDMEENCSFYTLGDQSNSENFTFDAFLIIIGEKNGIALKTNPIINTGRLTSKVRNNPIIVI